MRELREQIEELLDGEAGAQARQGASLRQAWRQVAPPAVLSHTGSVITDKADPDVLVVFTDSSFIQADLSAEKELYRILLSNILRPEPAAPLKEVRFAVSRLMPSERQVVDTLKATAVTKVEPVGLSAEEEGHARESVSIVRDERLKQSLFKAMKTQIEWKKGKDALKTP